MPPRAVPKRRPARRVTTLFTVGALRALVTVDRWWIAGLEMLGLGAAVALLAYGSGAVVARIVGG